LAQHECSALPGTAEALATHAEAYLIFGEVHGSREAPRAFAAIVCEAARRGPVVVGIERPPTLTAPIQSFIDSDGGAQAEASLLTAVFDGSQYGLSSGAFLDLFRSLRDLRARGATLRVVAFQGGEFGPADNQTPYELSLAQHIIRASEGLPGARVVVLVGNLHARKTPIPPNDNRPGFEPMAMHLPRGDVLSFDLAYGEGEVFNCTPSGCGPHAVSATDRSVPPRVELAPGESFDGFWAVGPLTASSPVRGQ
jgi:hypothetical protein